MVRLCGVGLCCVLSGFSYSGGIVPGLLRDSMEKIVEVYFWGITAQEFTYRGKVFKPKKIVVSPLIFRGTTCPMGCGGCCQRFSLVWLPSEPQPLNLHRGVVEVNGIRQLIHFDPQTDHKDHFCRHLQKKTGLCGIHGDHPFTCKFELIRFTHQPDRVDIATRLFGRGWSYQRVTGQVGALCDVLPPSEKHREDAIEKFTQLLEWTRYFELRTHIPRIITWLQNGPHDEPLTILPGTISLLDR